MIAGGTFQESIPRYLAPISDLLEDPEVSEVMINGPFEVWIERGGQLHRTPYRFVDSHSLEAALTNISQFCGRPLGEHNPILEAHLPDGSRIEAVLPPLASHGPIVAIRKFSRSTLSLEKLVSFGSITKAASSYLAAAVRAKKNIVISGGTGTGKTSLLGALAATVEENERIIVIEDTKEISISNPHVVYLESRSADERGRGKVSIRDLLRATLRLRPDRIVVGEVRGAEAIDMIQSMTCGHGGSMTTAHADTPSDALRRLETMILMADTALPLFAVREQLASGIDMIVQVTRARDGRRGVGEICRVLGVDSKGGYVVLREFVRDRSGRLCKVKRKTGPGETSKRRTE